jgi:putative hydrolase of the HAD superfamily
VTIPPAQALVLDFGGVISKTLFETHHLTETALGLAPDTLHWLGPFAPETDPLWMSMQRGEVSERDYWLIRSREVGRLVGEDWYDMETFVRRARGTDPEAVIRPEADRAIRMVADAGFQLAILSNELDLFYGASFRKVLPMLGRFQTIVDATYTKILKPDPRAYCSTSFRSIPAPASSWTIRNAISLAPRHAACEPSISTSAPPEAATQRHYVSSVLNSSEPSNGNDHARRKLSHREQRQVDLAPDGASG